MSKVRSTYKAHFAISPARSRIMLVSKSGGHFWLECFLSGIMNSDCIGLSRSRHPSSLTHRPVLLHEPRIAENDSLCKDLTFMNQVYFGFILNKDTSIFPSKLLRCRPELDSRVYHLQDDVLVAELDHLLDF
jgi:hypothetical protein